MSNGRRLHHSYDDYLRALELSAVKFEYCDGEIYALAARTPAHADLAASITRLLGNALEGRCRVFSSDLKVRIEATALSTFPDVTILCGRREVADIDPKALTNPTVLVEVTSNATEDYDRGEKLRHYQQLQGLAAVLFISHRRHQVTVVERTGANWTKSEYGAGETVTLTNPSVSVAVDELYMGIELDAR